jgi:hypothetical protein
MTKTFVIAAVTAIGLSAMGVTASYADHGQGSSAQENRSQQSIAAQQAATRGPERLQSLLGNQQAISGLVSAAASARLGVLPESSNVNRGATTPSICAPGTVASPALNC